MALYVLADLHLALGVNKPMDIFGGAWTGYAEKIKENLNVLQDDDILIIPGDVSWGLNLKQALADFKMLDAYPGKKYIVKGNHDLWWDTVTKMNRFFAEHEITTIGFIYNNCVVYEHETLGKLALCGTRGWFFEEEKSGEHDEKMLNREVIRLRASLEAGKKENPDAIIAFLHYPPLYGNYDCAPIRQVLEEYNVSTCYYGHLHSESCRMAFQGVKNGVKYRLVSGDSVNFLPILI